MPASLGAALKRCWPFYAAGLAMIILLKLFCRAAGPEELGWILSPTARWVEILTGIPFEKELAIGYVNHGYRVVIVPSCSGVRYMPVVFATLLFPFIHSIRPRLPRLCWLGASLLAAYGHTVFANGIRIALSIRLRGVSLPLPVSPELLHTLEGMAVYFAALCAVYHLAARASRRWSGGQEAPRPPSGWAVPAALYFALTLGVPLLRGEYGGNPGRFAAYFGLMLLVFLAVALAGRLASAVRRGINRRSG